MPRASVSDATFNATGNLIASASKDGAIRFWDARSGLCLKTLAQHHGEVTSVQLSANGLQMLSAAKDNSVRLWDVRAQSPRPVAEVTTAHTAAVTSAMFDPCTGRQLLTNSRDNSLCLIDVRGSLEALASMRVGGKRTLRAPSSLGYGATGERARCLRSGNARARTHWKKCGCRL